jgi:demethylmenaquinone methyltransferase/2-methoxy-6-polyprenyl-1,4-benzoquinol methylase
MMKHAPAMSPEDKQDKVFRVFENIAKGYDRANVRISLGMQDSWKRMLIREITGSCFRRARILDLCTGTGDIALGIAKAGENYRVTGMDFSPPCCGSQPSKRSGSGSAEFTGGAEMPWNYLTARRLLTP